MLADSLMQFVTTSMSGGVGEPGEAALDMHQLAGEQRKYCK